MMVFFSTPLLIRHWRILVLVFAFFPVLSLRAQNPVPPASTGTVAAAPASSSAIKTKIVYNALDSVRFDVENQKVFLYGEADVQFETMTLKADYIEFNMKSNIAFSRGARDSAGNVKLDSAGMAIGDPVFADGPKSFDAKEITYNFETKKGKIRDVTTQEGEAFIHAKDAKKDTGDVYYIQNGRYTTCDAENPHFYIKATKLKIIPDDKIISGPAYLVIGDVPTPLVLPFGIFPNKTGRKSGVLIPFYGESNLGYFLKDGGYYFGFSDYWDLALRGDIYSKGSYGLKANTNYNSRYKYSGNLGLSYSNIQISEKEFPDYTSTQDFFVRWSHAQDVKASPTSRFSANVNAGSSTYQKFNSMSANEYLANTFQSNIAWNKSWQGSPNNLSVNMSHNQNTLNKTVNIVLPEAAFTMGRRYPFKRKNVVGKQNIIEKIGISPAVYAKNQISTYDSLLFKPEAIDKFQNGFKAYIPISTAMNLGPVNITPSASANGYGYFQSVRKRWALDTATDKLMLFTDTVRQLSGAYDYNAAISASTKIFGMFAFRNAKVIAIRHVMTPALSYSIRPDFSEYQYGYYYYVRKDAINPPTKYSIFENGIYGSPQAGKAGFIRFSLDNNVEMKLRPQKKDTAGADRKIMLVESFNISASYNIAADIMNWSPIVAAARTRLFKVVDITFNGTIDPYVYDTTYKKRINKLELKENGRIGQVTSASFALSTSLRSLAQKTDQPKAKAKKRLTPLEHDQLSYVMMHPDYYVDFKAPWDLALNYNILYANPDGRDTVIQSFSFYGNVSITEKWKIGLRSGFDFIEKDFTFTSLDIYRDLHCWEMHFSWIPFGFKKSYQLSVAVKASVLQDLKLMRKRDWYDYN